MPGWSTDIAAVFVAAGGVHGLSINQMQLQKLVYIAHGWCLAASGEPLTGDRPEAWDLGPMYRRLADALAWCGLHPVTLADFGLIGGAGDDQLDQILPGLDPIQRDVIHRVLLRYGVFSSVRLSVLTRGDDAPWHTVFRSGQGRFRDIPHVMIRDQFVRLAERI